VAHQLYDLTHAIDALEDDVDQILALRNKIASLDPRCDPGEESIRADLNALSALTTTSGKAIVSLETWLIQLHSWAKDVRELVKAGKAHETLQEIAEIKFQLSGAKLVRPPSSSSSSTPFNPSSFPPSSLFTIRHRPFSNSSSDAS
jgi:hypothetical protein